MHLPSSCYIKENMWENLITSIQKSPQASRRLLLYIWYLVVFSAHPGSPPPPHCSFRPSLHPVQLSSAPQNKTGLDLWPFPLDCAAPPHTYQLPPPLCHWFHIPHRSPHVLHFLHLVKKEDLTYLQKPWKGYETGIRAFWLFASTSQSTCSLNECLFKLKSDKLTTIKIQSFLPASVLLF